MIVSFLIPVKNEISFISSAINSIINQRNYSKKFEILIALGESTDGTLETINKFIVKYPFIKLINNPRSIVSTGFNLALNQARGEIIIRIDGHCEIPPEYFIKCCKLLERKDADIVGGVIETISTGIIGKAISIAQSSWFGVGGVKFRRVSLEKSGFVDSLAFGAHKRELFAEIGGYDEDMVYNQDDEFNFRVIQAGKKIWVDPTIRTKYFARSSFGKLFKQYFNYGCYKIRGIQKRKQLFSIRHLIPFVFIMGLFSTIIYGLNYNNPIISILVLFPYIVCNSIFSIITSPSIQTIPFIFISFWTLHLGYGLGFTWGLIRFIGKWNDTSLKDYHFNREKFLANNPVS